MQGFRLVSARLMGCFFAVTFSSLASAQAYKLTELDIAPQNVALYEELRELLGFEEGSYFKGITAKLQVDDDFPKPEFSTPVTSCVDWVALHLEKFTNSTLSKELGKRTDPLKDFVFDPEESSKEWVNTFCWETSPTVDLPPRENFKSHDVFLETVRGAYFERFQLGIAHTLLRLILSAEESSIKQNLVGKDDLWVKKTMQNARVQFSKYLFVYLKVSQNPNYREVADRLFDIVIRPTECSRFSNCFDFLSNLSLLQSDFVGPLASVDRIKPIQDAVKSAKTPDFYQKILDYQLKSIEARAVVNNILLSGGLQEGVLGRRLVLDDESFKKTKELLESIVGENSLLRESLESDLVKHYHNDWLFRGYFGRSEIRSIEKSLVDEEEIFADRPEAQDDLEKMSKEAKDKIEYINQILSASPDDLALMPLPNTDVLLKYAIMQCLAVEAYFASKKPEDVPLYAESTVSGMYTANEAIRGRYAELDYREVIIGSLVGLTVGNGVQIIAQRTAYQLIESYHRNLGFWYYVNTRLNPDPNSGGIEFFIYKVRTFLAVRAGGKVDPNDFPAKLPVGVRPYAIYYSLLQYSELELYQPYRHQWLDLVRDVSNALIQDLENKTKGSEFEFSAIMQISLSPDDVRGLVEDMESRLKWINNFIQSELKRHQLYVLLGNQSGVAKFSIAEGEVLLSRLPGFESFFYELSKINRLTISQLDSHLRYLANMNVPRYIDQPENEGLIRRINELEESIVEQRLVLACYGYWLPLQQEGFFTDKDKVVMTTNGIADPIFVLQKPDWQKKFIFTPEGRPSFEYRLEEICGHPTRVKESVRSFLAKQSMKDKSTSPVANTLKYTGGMLMDISAYFMMGTAFNYGTRALAGSARLGRAGATTASKIEMSPSTIKRVARYLAWQGGTLVGFSLMSAGYSTLKHGGSYSGHFREHLIYGSPIFFLMPLTNVLAARQLYTRSLFGFRRGADLSSRSMAEQLRDYRILKPDGKEGWMTPRDRLAYHALPTFYNGMLLGSTPMAVRAVEISLGKKNQRVFYSWEASAQEMTTGLFSAAMFRIIGTIAEHRVLPGAKEMRAQRQKWLDEIGEVRERVLKTELKTAPDNLLNHPPEIIAKDVLKLDSLKNDKTQEGRAAVSLRNEYDQSLKLLESSNLIFVKSVRSQISLQRGPVNVELTPLEVQVNNTRLIPALRKIGWREDLPVEQKIEKLESIKQDPQFHEAASRMVESLRAELHTEMLGVLKAHGYPSEASVRARFDWLDEFMQSSHVSSMSPVMQSALQAQVMRLQMQIPYLVR